MGSGDVLIALKSHFSLRVGILCSGTVRANGVDAGAAEPTTAGRHSAGNAGGANAIATIEPCPFCGAIVRALAHLVRGIARGTGAGVHAAGAPISMGMATADAATKSVFAASTKSIRGAGRCARAPENRAGAIGARAKHQSIKDRAIENGAAKRLSVSAAVAQTSA